jgi:hypothetical protein
MGCCLRLVFHGLQFGSHVGLLLLQQGLTLFGFPDFFFLLARWNARLVPPGTRRPTMTFSFMPRRPSRLPMTAASVSMRVVSWNDAAEMNESLDSEALMVPESAFS